jgi:catechol 2,3-dioxygenase-like lactoylglutathione lyase family enzyme
VIVWYGVRDLAESLRFYEQRLGFTQTYVDEEGRWARLVNGSMEIGLAEGEPAAEGGVAHVDVDDVKAAAEKLREQGVEVGIVIEIPQGGVRLVDVFDLDGNRLQLAEELPAGQV